MGRSNRKYDALELLESNDYSSPPQRNSNAYTNGTVAERKTAKLDSRDRPTAAFSIGRLPGIKALSYLLPLLASIVPLALLLGFSGQIANPLSKSACTPGGEFVMPSKSSLWDGKRFFEITIPFSGPEVRGCSGSMLDPFRTNDCRGYTFTEVKVIDLAWDVLVGRGGQALLILVGYRVFSHVIMALMEQGEVGYDAFAAVAFGSASLSSLVPLFRQSVGFTPLTRTSRAAWCYIGILLATTYIVSVPSLVSAVTGYTTIFTPFARLGSLQGPNGTLVNCYPGFVPVWGRMDIPDFKPENGQRPGISPLVGTNTSIVSIGYGDIWIDYYDRYNSVYEECPKSLDISSCPAAQKETVLRYHYFSGFSEYRIASPMPGILPYPNNTDIQGARKYRYWQCGYDQLIDSHGLVQSPDFDVNTDPDEQSVGVCQAGRRYAWGFSFLFAFLIAVLHLVFTVLMYVLWLIGRRHGNEIGTAVASGVFPDAVTMVVQAQRQYGAKLDRWSARELNRKIVRGKTGMTYSSGKSSNRSRVAERSQASGDEDRGGWGETVSDDGGSR